MARRILEPLLLAVLVMVASVLGRPYLNPVWFAVAGLIGFMLVLGRRIRRINQLNVEGATLLRQGRALAAAAKFDEACTLSPASVLRANAGNTRIALWELPKARELLEASQRASRLMLDVRPIAYPALTYVCALQNDVASFERYAQQGRTLALQDSAILLLAQAIIAVRQARWPDAEALLGRTELQQLGGQSRALQDVLTAWCRQQRGASPSPINKPALFGEVGPERLRAVWPELVAFVEGAPA